MKRASFGRLRVSGATSRRRFLHSDVIVLGGPRGLGMMRGFQTPTTPIVLVVPLAASVDDLIAGGFIKSQAQPGGTVTGLVGAIPSLWSKRLDLLKETVPGATRVGALRDPRAPDPLASPPAWVRSFP